MDLSITCIQVSSIWPPSDDASVLRAGGRGWISFGTTTRSLPKTKIAPALFAVPVNNTKHKKKLTTDSRIILVKYHIICITTIICCGEKGNQVPLGKPLKTIHYTLMCTYNQL